MVLIIENDDAQALLVRLALERHGTLPDGTSLACAIAANGAEVAAMLASTTPTTIAVVILDRHLDGLNCLSLIPLLRQSPALRPDAIVIA